MPLAKNVPYKFIVLVTLFLIADFVIDNVNHRFVMGDFKVYYEAARAITGGKQVYGVCFSSGSGYYKYSPFIALLFYPFSLLPYYASCVIYFIFISAATIFTSILLLHIFNKYVASRPVKSPNVILSLSVLCISIHLIREAGLGNVNMLLLLLLSLSLLFIINKKKILPGILLSLVIITKPFFILILLLLLMRRHFKTIIVTVVSLVIFMILPAVILGVGKDIEVHKQWLNAIFLHAGNFPSPNTIGALLRYYLTVGWNFQYAVIISLLCLYLIFVGINILNNGKDGKTYSVSFIMEWFILIALMPSMFRTDTEHFLLLLPIIIFLLIYIFSNKNIPLTLLFSILIILYAGNSSDLLGKNLSVKVYNMGILGISNVLIIALAVFVYFIYSGKMAIVNEG